MPIQLPSFLGSHTRNQQNHDQQYQANYGYSYGDPALYVPSDIPGTVEHTVPVNPPWAAPYNSANNQPQSQTDPVAAAGDSSADALPTAASVAQGCCNPPGLLARFCSCCPDWSSMVGAI